MPQYSGKFYYDTIAIPDENDVGYISVNNVSVNNFRKAQRLMKQIDLELANESCPYCKRNILILKKEFSGVDKEWEEEIDADFSVCYCQNCAYWSIYENVNIDGFTDSGNHSRVYASKLKEYDPVLPEFFKEELAIAFRRKPQLWHTINPTSFEKFVGAIFKANHNNCEVLHVGGPNDLGKDLYFITAEKEEWLIQVKRRESSTYREPVSTIIHLLGAMTIENNKKAIVVSTADRFTTNAINLVKRMEPLGMTVKVIDRGILNRMLDGLIPDKLPLTFLKSSDRDLSLLENNYKIEFNEVIKELELVMNC